MISGAQEHALVSLCHKFINSGDDVTLAHLMDAVSATIPNHQSQEWDSWSKHMDRLNEVWVLRHKEGENIPWPKVREITWALITTLFT